MRRFWLWRDEDETGVSGCGPVAEGVQFSDDSLAMKWRTEHTSTAVYKDEATLLAIHGHDGRTRIVWLDSRGDGALGGGEVARDHVGRRIRRGDLVLPVRLMEREREPYVVTRAPERDKYGRWRVSSVGWPECGYGLGSSHATKMVVVTHPDRPPCPSCGARWERHGLVGRGWELRCSDDCELG